MADDERFIIEHEDGRRFSVTAAAHEELYPDFTVVGAESDADFTVTGVPAPKKSRKKPHAKDAAPIAVEAPAEAPVEAPEEPAAAEDEG